MTGVTSAVLASVISLAAAAPNLSAQDVYESSKTLALDLKQAQTANQLVRLRSLFGAESVGRVAAVTDSTVRIGRQTLRFVDQSSFEARFSRPDPLWNGAAIGAAANLALGYPLALLFAESLSDTPITRGEELSMALGAAIFGMLVGGAVDAAREHPGEWRLIWKRAEP